MKIYQNSIGHWVVGRMIIPAGQAQVEVDGTQVTISLINRFVVIFSDDVTKLQREDGSFYGNVDTFLSECRFFFVNPTDPLLEQEVYKMQIEVNKLQAIVDAMQSIGVMKIYTTYALMDADKDAPETDEGVLIKYGQLVAVTEDPDTSNNGLFRWIEGSWEFVKDLGDLSIYARNGGSVKTLQDLDDEVQSIQEQVTDHDSVLPVITGQVKGFVPITLPAITEDYYVDTDGVITSSENVHGYYELTTNLPDKIKITASNSNGEGVAFAAFFNEDTFISYEGAGNIDLTDEEIDVPEGTTKILISVDLTNDNSTHVSFLQLDAVSKDYVVSGGFGYFGVATPTDTPVNNNAPKYYIAKQVGTYTNFGGLEITTPGVYFLKYLRGVWTLEDMTDIFS